MRCVAGDACHSLLLFPKIFATSGLHAALPSGIPWVTVLHRAAPSWHPSGHCFALPHSAQHATTAPRPPRPRPPLDLQDDAIQVPSMTSYARAMTSAVSAAIAAPHVDAILTVGSPFLSKQLLEGLATASKSYKLAVPPRVHWLTASSTAHVLLCFVLHRHLSR